MIERKGSIGTVLSPSARVCLEGLLCAAAIAILIMASLPALRGHSHEVDEVGPVAAWLVTVGRTCGLLAATLVLLQFALSAKIKALDRVFGLHRLLMGHRVLATAIVILASSHPLFIFAPKTIEIGPMRLDIWPVLVGVALLIGLWAGVCTALGRGFLQLPYSVWYRFHRVVMIGSVVLLAFHVLTVTEAIREGWPVYALAVALGLYAVLFFWTAIIKPRHLRRQAYSLIRISPAGKDTFAIELSLKNGEPFAYLPGQFAFVTFRSDALPAERHPWTISSTPTRPEGLIFTIKCSGDFTALIGRLRPGDTAIVDGPYGLFSHLALVQDRERELIMVAGGVGVTPMLSMLRYMADTGDKRKTTLLWSNQTEADILYRAEFEGLQQRLPNFTCHHILTRQEVSHGASGRLDSAMLERLFPGSSREASVFVCGPPSMMDDVTKALRQVGFRAHRIHTERFSI
jgi:predicted ferric reductase